MSLHSFSILSFRAQARNLFRLRSNKKREGIGKRETRYSIRYFLRSGITAFHLGIKNPLKQFDYLRCLL